MNFLIDYNLTGDAVLFWGTLAAEGWIELLSILFSHLNKLNYQQYVYTVV